MSDKILQHIALSGGYGFNFSRTIHWATVFHCSDSSQDFLAMDWVRKKSMISPHSWFKPSAPCQFFVHGHLEPKTSNYLQLRREVGERIRSLPAHYNCGAWPPLELCREGTNATAKRHTTMRHSRHACRNYRGGQGLDFPAEPPKMCLSTFLRAASTTDGTCTAKIPSKTLAALVRIPHLRHIMRIWQCGGARRG